MNKPYETDEHKAIHKHLEQASRYIQETLKDENDNDKFARLSPDVLSLVLFELTALYESFSKWLANEKLHLADLKAFYDISFSTAYLNHKKQGETNETARMKAKIACSQYVDEINEYRHLFDSVEAVKKTIGRYHDSVRSQLSYEKQQEAMGRGVR